MLNEVIGVGQDHGLYMKEVACRQELKHGAAPAALPDIVFNGQDPAGLSGPEGDEIAIQRFDEAGVDDRCVDPELLQALGGTQGRINPVRLFLFQKRGAIGVPRRVKLHCR